MFKNGQEAGRSLGDTSEQDIEALLKKALRKDTPVQSLLAESPIGAEESLCRQESVCKESQPRRGSVPEESARCVAATARAGKRFRCRPAYPRGAMPRVFFFKHNNPMEL